MKIIDTILYIELSEFELCGISENTVRMGYHRNSVNWQGVKDPYDKRRLLIQYHSLKPLYQKAISHELCGGMDPLEYYHKNDQGFINTLHTLVACKEKDRKFFRDTGYFTEKQVRNLSESAAWLDMILEYGSDKDWLNDNGFKNRKKFIEAIMPILHKKQLKGLGKVTNYRSFCRKIDTYQEQGAESLISAKYGNRNAEKLTDLQKATLRSLYSDHRKFTLPTIHVKYLRLAKENDWPEVCFETVRSYLMEPAVQIKTQTSRNGKAYWRNVFDPILKRVNARIPNDMWTIDGSPWELFYKEYNETKRRWEFRKRVYGFPVIDVHSWKILGFANGFTETEDLVFAAIKEAYKATGVLPVVLQSDNSAAIKANSMQEWFSNIPTKYIPAEPHMGRSKVIETMFKSFNSQILKEFHNFAGHGITSKKQDSHANEEWLLANKDAIPSKEEVLRQIDLAIDLWNKHQMGDGLSPNQKYQAVRNEKAHQLDLIDQSSFFWKYLMSRKGEKQIYQYTNKGITIQRNNRKFDYHVYDADGQIDKKFWRAHVNDRFEVKYDFEDMTMVALYQDNKFVAFAQEQRLGNMNPADNTPDDASFLKKFLKERKDLYQEVKETTEKDADYLQRKGVDLELAEVIEQEGYLKAPYPEKGVFKDRSNEAESAFKSRNSIYDIDDNIEIVDEE